MYNQADICFNYSITYTNPAPPPPSTLPVMHDASGRGYDSVQYCRVPRSGRLGSGRFRRMPAPTILPMPSVTWKPSSALPRRSDTAAASFAATQPLLNPLAPSGTLDYNYQLPFGSINFDIYKGLSYKMAWNYYGFNQEGNTSPFGLAAIPLQNFDGSNATFSFRYAF